MSYEPVPVGCIGWLNARKFYRRSFPYETSDIANLISNGHALRLTCYLKRGGRCDWFSVKISGLKCLSADPGHHRGPKSLPGRSFENKVRTDQFARGIKIEFQHNGDGVSNPLSEEHERFVFRIIDKDHLRRDEVIPLLKMFCFLV